MYSSHVAHVHSNALTCSISSMVEGSASRTAHVWLTCMLMPSCVAFPQWWKDIHAWRGHSRVGITHMWRGHSCVAHVHGNALTCSISSMVERSPSRTAHVWLTCMVMPSRVAFPQWWRDINVWDLLTCGGDIHMWDLLTCGGDIHVWPTCTVMPSRVAFPQWWRGAPHVQLTCGSRGW